MSEIYPLRFLECTDISIGAHERPTWRAPFLARVCRVSRNDDSLTLDLLHRDGATCVLRRSIPLQWSVLTPPRVFAARLHLEGLAGLWRVTRIDEASEYARFELAQA